MVILASGSPRRQERMKQIVDDFVIIVSDIDENVDKNLPPLEAVLKIAKRKGEAVFKNHPNDIVLSADTIVVLNNKIIGKPIDEEDARKILRELSGETHTVITAYCWFKGNQIIENYVVSEVTFHKFNDDFINKYIATGSPLDKAGAYGVQDPESKQIIKEIKGSVDNVIGFPIKEIKDDYQKIK